MFTNLNPSVSESLWLNNPIVPGVPELEGSSFLRAFLIMQCSGLPSASKHESLRKQCHIVFCGGKLPELELELYTCTECDKQKSALILVVQLNGRPPAV